MYKLEDDGTELLLTVPYAERERAKGIPGRKWDPDRKAWIYPRSKAVYDAIIAEFGTELERVSRPAFGKKPPEAAATPGRTGRHEPELHEQIKELQRTLKAVHQGGATGAAAMVEALKDQLKAREKSEQSTLEENRVLHRKVAELESRVAVTEAELERAQYRAARDGEELIRLRAAQSTKGKENPEAAFKQQLIQVVTGTAPGAHELSGLISRRGFHDQLPVEIGGLLETTLRSRLKVRDRSSLFDLIDTARDAELLTDEGYHMATTVRVERNKVAHDNVAAVTYRARALLVLAAATLFYSELQ